MQVDRHFSENVLLSMEKLIKKVCLRSKFYAYCGDSRKSSRASFYSIKVLGSLLFSFIPIENVYIQLIEI